MAAMVCSSLISASSLVVIANPKTRNAINISIPSLYNPLSFPSSSRYISRRSCQVRATTLQEKDEKVNVEDSFRTRSISADEGNLCDADQSEVTPGMVERWVIKIEQNLNVLLTDSVIRILDTLYHDRHYARFFVLETIARVPYFAFISVLHLYETFGWWRRADYIKVHFAESWNELHHLLIMEELGGNAVWFDRFLAQHMAFFYYFMTVIMYALSPRMAYHFSECVERHAYSTYDKFIKLQEEELKTLPAPEIAIKYYMNEDLYMFDEFQTDRIPNTRRPKIENLYDVFVNIRDDEAEHCKTMMACQTHGKLRSPHSVANELVKSRDDDEDSDSGCIVPAADCEGIVDCVKQSLTSSV